MMEFQPIKTLSKRLFRQNRGRNLVAVTAVIMTTLMFTTLFVLSQSMKENMTQMAFRQSGYDAHVSFKSITEEQTALLAAHPDVKEAGSSIVLGVAQNKELAGRQVEIRWADQSYAAHSFSAPTVGALPQGGDEIALDTIVLDLLGIPHELGQTVTLEWIHDFSNPEIFSSTFTLCGYWEGNLSGYASLALVDRTFADRMIAEANAGDGQILGIRMAQLTLHSGKDIEGAIDKLLADTGLSELEYSLNLAYSPELNAGVSQESLSMYLGMLLVFAAGYLIIYNIFQISVSADIRLYGKLKTLGATMRQMKKLIYGQANRICLIGIPIGLISGYLLGMVLVPVLMGMMDGKASVSTSPVIFIGSALFAWLTVLLSCLRPARLAGRVSPIEALRASDAETGSGFRGKKRRGNASLYSMAWSNLGRNKKRTATVICSLTLGLVLLSCFYAKNASFDLDKYLSDLILADFELADATHKDHLNGYNPMGNTLNKELLSQVEALDGLEAAGHLYTHEETCNLDDATARNISGFYTPDRLKEWAAYDPSGAKAVEDAISEKKAKAILLGIDGIPLEKLTETENLASGSFDPEKFASGDYVIAFSPSIEIQEARESGVLPVPSVGSQIELAGRTYTVMAIALPLNPITEGASAVPGENSFDMRFAIPAAAFRELWPEYSLRKLFINVSEEGQEAAREMLDEYTSSVDSGLSVGSREAKAAQYQKETRSSAVMGNAVSVVIALVGVLNFVNSMVTAIVSRKREFAMIQSVGMTKRQLNRMLICEGLYYAVITLAVSFAAGSLAVGVGVRAMVEGGFSTFHFTLLPLAVCTPFLLLFAVLIPFLCFRNLEKQSIVERLRIE